MDVLDHYHCITVWNPWAAAILLGGKDIENRWYAPPAAAVGKPLLIHAGKRYSDRAMGRGHHCGGRLIHQLPLTEARGAFLGLVTLHDAVPAQECQEPWCEQMPGAYAWRLVEPWVFRQPVPWRGEQRVWNARPDALLRASIHGAMTPAAWASQKWREDHDAGMSRAAQSPGGLGSLD